jgi:hypothetical protein
VNLDIKVKKKKKGAGKLNNSELIYLKKKKEHYTVLWYVNFCFAFFYHPTHGNEQDFELESQTYIMLNKKRKKKNDNNLKKNI